MFLPNAKHHLHLLLSFGLAFRLAGCAAPEAEEFTPRALEAEGLSGKIWQVHNFYLASQPTAANLATLKARGVRTLICLRSVGEITEFDEPEAARGLGLEFVSIPVNSQMLEVSAIDAFIAAVKISKRQTLIYGSSADRVSALWAAYLGLNYGLTADRAVALAEHTGLESDDLKAAVRLYLQGRQRGGADSSPSTS